MPVVANQWPGRFAVVREEDLLGPALWHAPAYVGDHHSGQPCAAGASPMFVSIAVHRVKADAESLMVDSMHRFGEAAKAAGGIQQVHTLKDERSGALVGLAIWESKDAYEAAGPALMAAVANDDFDAWHEERSQVYHCFEV